MNKRYVVITLIVSSMTFMTACIGAMKGITPEIIPDLAVYHQETQIVPMQYHYLIQQVVSYLPSEQFMLCRREEVCAGKGEFTPVSPQARMNTIEPPSSPQTLLPRLATPPAEIPLRSVVYFPSGSAELESKALSTLDQMISRLKGADLSSLRMVIAGYTDSVGSMEINTRLARARTDAVANYFREKGISPTEMVTGGRPLCCYVTPNDTVDGRSGNRRAEIWIEPIAEETGDEKPE